MTTAANSAAPRIYLAGPDVFELHQADIFRSLIAECSLLGLEGVAPFDGQIDTRSGETPDAFAHRIYQGNIDRIRACDGVVANLRPFRGLEPDPGTVFEVGFAVALGKPVVGYHVPAGSYAERVQRERSCRTDEDGTVRETADGSLVEGLGQPINLMISRSVSLVPDARAALAVLAGRLRHRG
ncbi:nucleoside 2-deoxyribosyltransferase [Xylophilus sp. GOD-11R]|uniref:nucleoside 2-deoxyribosyltransferase n=1 Tax=Xylophilus sp. GOD-11R TaxID=3089814 RepID=UPI00298CE393|nr:nucleoside 2-deoxyribosyltransferase [Xylophilus sp. GOD-11R]WPB57546.1 nucleoside 2-deoxyribosyltransferase [Xylophilus sp. GOD-11R]